MSSFGLRGMKVCLWWKMRAQIVDIVDLVPLDAAKLTSVTTSPPIAANAAEGGWFLLNRCVAVYTAHVINAVYELAFLFTRVQEQHKTPIYLFVSAASTILNSFTCYVLQLSR